MRVLIIVWFSLQILYANEMNQKMIMGAYLETEKAAQSLYEIEKFFQENAELRRLQKQYHITLSMELLEPYVLVIIKPIIKVSIKNKLRYFFQSKFPQNFVVDNTLMKKNNQKKKIVSTVINPQIKKDTLEQNIEKDTSEKAVPIVEPLKVFWRELENEWIGLIFLALAGFILVYRSARQMSKIKSLQEEVTKYQSKIEGEMEHLGHKRV